MTPLSISMRSFSTLIVYISLAAASSHEESSMDLDRLLNGDYDVDVNHSPLTGFDPSDENSKDDFIASVLAEYDIEDTKPYYPDNPVQPGETIIRKISPGEDMTEKVANQATTADEKAKAIGRENYYLLVPDLQRECRKLADNTTFDQLLNVTSRISDPGLQGCPGKLLRVCQLALIKAMISSAHSKKFHETAIEALQYTFPSEDLNTQTVTNWFLTKYAMKPVQLVPDAVAVNRENQETVDLMLRMRAHEHKMAKIKSFLKGK